MIVDSHCHLDRIDLAPFDNDLENALAAAAAQDVGHFLCVCIDLNNFSDVLRIAKQHKQISASMGIHPTESLDTEPTVEMLCKLADEKEVVAIGETGLDYFHCKGDLTWQHERFRRHIHTGIETDRPLIIHSRDAREDTIRILTEEHAEKCGGVMHCFTETWEMAQQAMALGFYISFSGIVTFKNAKDLQAAAKQVPLEKMLIETDSPYLAPTPHRGKTNQPAYVRHVADFLAELKGVSYEEFARVTTQNFFRCFSRAAK
jgi:TatD DNase family protein